MPRIARKSSGTSLYHVVNRGSGKQIIFEDDSDRSYFMKKLDTVVAENGGRLLAWCLMDNHFHLLVEIPYDRLSILMHRIQTSYAGYFNRVHGRVGQLFGSRFKSEPVEDDEYLMTLVRYIHENPVKAAMPKGLRYPWSSYSEYVGSERHIDSSLVLGVFGGRSQFRAFHEGEHAEERCMDVDDSPSAPRLTDERALQIANEILGEGVTENLRGMAREPRNQALSLLKRSGLGVRQIQRLTGVSLSVVSKAGRM